MWLYVPIPDESNKTNPAYRDIVACEFGASATGEKKDESPTETLSQLCLGRSWASTDCTRKCKSYDKDHSVKP